MSDLAEKLQILKCPKEMYDNALEFAVSLSLVSVDDIKNILQYLTEKGIAKEEEGKPLLPVVAFQILPLGLEEIKTRVEQMESLGHIACYVAKPARINIKDAHLRIAYMLKQGDPVINEKGKYVKQPFDQIAFKEKYGKVDLAQALGESAPIEDMSGEIDKPIDFGETVIKEPKESKEEVSAETVAEDPFVEKVETTEAALVKADVPVVEAPAVEGPVAAPEVAASEPVIPPVVNENTAEVVSAPVVDAPAVEGPVTAPEVAVSETVTPPVANENTAEVVSAPEIDTSSVQTAEASVQEETTPVVEAPIQEETPQVEDGKNEKIEFILAGLYPALFGINEVPSDMLESAKAYAATSNKLPEELVFDLVTMGSSYTDDQKAVIQKTITDISASAPSIGGR